MTTPNQGEQASGAWRPVSVVQPADADLQRALRAIEEDRLNDARGFALRCRDNSQLGRVWQKLVMGMLEIKTPNLPRAEALLQMAVSGGCTATIGHDSAEDSTFRLTALALEQLGVVYRREDRLEEAADAHEAAQRVRDQHGSWEELWETAQSLAVVADLARDYDKAQRWHRRAIELGTLCTEESERKQAITYNHLSRSLIESGAYVEAVLSARDSCVHWRQHDLGALAAAKADLTLGYAMLRQGESLHDHDAGEAASALDSALETLRTAREALLAFGPDAAADAEWCGEQIDFAERLRASIEKV